MLLFPNFFYWNSICWGCSRTWRWGKGRQLQLRAEKFHNAESHNQYCSPNILRVMKARRMKWAGHVALMSEKRNASRVCGGGGWEHLKERATLNSSKPTNRDLEPTKSHDSLSASLLKCHYMLRWHHRRALIHSHPRRLCRGSMETGLVTPHTNQRLS